MNDVRIDPRSPLAMARLAAEDPAAAAALTPGYRASTVEDRRVVDGILDRHGDELGPDVVGLLREEGFGACRPEGRSALLRALEGHPTRAAAGRLQLLAADPAFPFLDGPSAREQAEAVVTGTAFPEVADLLPRTGAVRPPAERHGALSWAELGAHALEGLAAAEALHGTTLAAVGELTGGAVVGPLAIVGGLYEIAEAHHAGERWAEAVRTGQGYLDHLEGLLRGEEPSLPRGGHLGEGAAQAETFWITLEPAQRVALREAATDELLAELRRVLEQRTMAGARGPFAPVRP